MLLAGIIAAAAAYAASWACLRIARRSGWFARKNFRTSHRLPTPLLGGAAVATGFAMGAGWCAIAYNTAPGPSIGLVAGFLLMTAVGLADDRISLSPWQKLAGQAAAAAVVVGVMGGIAAPFPVPEWTLYGLAALWIVGATNALNLIDGLDGLASGTALSAAGTFAAAALAVSDRAPEAALAALLFAGVLGFLPYNLPTAKMFLGDAGSLSIGCALAALGLRVCFQQTENAALYLLPLTALSLPIFDTAAAIIRRRSRWAHADKEHLHHRLQKRGWSPQKTAAALTGSSAALSAAGAAAALWNLLPLAVGAAAASYLLWTALYRSPSIQPAPRES